MKGKEKVIKMIVIIAKGKKTFSKKACREIYQTNNIIYQQTQWEKYIMCSEYIALRSKEQWGRRKQRRKKDRKETTSGHPSGAALILRLMKAKAVINSVLFSF